MRIPSFQIFVVGLLSVLAMQARGDFFYVTSSLDTTNSDSLRGAIIAANARRGVNTIVLEQSYYQLTRNNTIQFPFFIPVTNGYAGNLVITRGNLTIIGRARHSSIIDASGLGYGAFQVLRGAHLKLQNLFITGGSNTTSALLYAGSLGQSSGAIYNAGELELVDCVITGNSSQNGLVGSGGGIDNIGAALLENCVVSGNTCGSVYIGNNGNGGGICNDGLMILNDCVINDNTCGSAGSYSFLFTNINGGNGGGIYNTGTLMLDNCIVIDNTAGNGGNGGNTLNNSSGRTGGNGGDGGGIYNVGALTTKNCMISNNACGSGGVGGEDQVIEGPGDSGVNGIGGAGGNGGSGGGIYNGAAASQAKLIETTVVSNQVGVGGNGGIAVILDFGSGPVTTGPVTLPGGPNGDPGTNGSGPNLFGTFTILNR